MAAATRAIIPKAAWRMIRAMRGSSSSSSNDARRVAAEAHLGSTFFMQSEWSDRGRCPGQAFGSAQVLSEAFGIGGQMRQLRHLDRLFIDMQGAGEGLRVAVGQEGVAEQGGAGGGGLLQAGAT